MLGSVRLRSGCGRRVRAAMLLAASSAAAVAQSGSATAFDVVSVKPNRSVSNGSSTHSDNDRFAATNLSLRSMVQSAYGLQTPDQVSGLPGWANSVNFDIQAKTDAEISAALKAAPREESAKIWQAMLQAMLADRFQLKVHPETRELPTYSLVLTKGGSKLREADPADAHNGSMNSHNQNLTVTGVEMAGLCRYLSQRLHRKVVDKTGLTGRYTYTLQWSPDEAAGESPDATGASPGPSLFTALEEQLGLRLDATRGPVDVIVVDKVEMPSEN